VKHGSGDLVTAYGLVPGTNVDGSGMYPRQSAKVGRMSWCSSICLRTPISDFERLTAIPYIQYAAAVLLWCICFGMNDFGQMYVRLG
jgi:hypothetical protein